MTLFAQRQRLRLPPAAPARKQQNLDEISTHTHTEFSFCWHSVDLCVFWHVGASWQRLGAHVELCFLEKLILTEQLSSCRYGPLSPPCLSFAPKALCWRLSPSLQPYSLSGGAQPDLNLCLVHGWGEGLTQRPLSSSSTEPGCPVRCLCPTNQCKKVHTSEGKKKKIRRSEYSEKRGHWRDSARTG